MKVICINNSNPIHADKMTVADMIYEGEIYTVDTIIYNGGAQYYHLAERKRDHDRVQYLSTRFVPLTGRGEDELEENVSLEEMIPHANLEVIE